MKEILVYADWLGLSEPTKIGSLRADALRGKEVFTFSYSEDWLRSAPNRYLDPDLNYYSGPQYLSDDKTNFGLFLDSSPDRWGRVLMKRKEALLAREERRPIRTLLESDFLLGVNDELRMGALRLKVDKDSRFLAYELGLEVPPFTSIRTLEEASLHIEDDDFFAQKDAKKWLHLLMATGSSLGGARPKANVRDTEGRLWIAKFPNRNDEWNMGAWEYVINQLAANLDIQLAETKAQRFSQHQHTFLSRRFDRNETGRRIHFASAMTLLGYKDGYNHQDGGSYLELVDLLERYGAAPANDIRELWRRVVFSVLVSNTDDHLRNHGFLLTASGWQLSPAYDINPNPQGYGLSLNISDNDNSQSLDLCLDVAPYFRWKQPEAQAFIGRARKEVQKWPDLATQLGISKAEQVMMADAFQLAKY